MPKYNLKYSPLAENDLDEIWEYIFRDASDKDVADNVINKIFDSIETLMEFPEIGVRLSNLTDIMTEHRFLAIDKYLVFYRFIDKTVYIDRILSSRQNYLKILFNTK